MIKLPNVTLIAMTGKDIEAHERALEESSKYIDFGDIKLVEKKFKNVDDWSYNIVYNLTDYVDTDFALLIHADGFVKNPKAWNPDFLKYDYIGAPWPMPEDDFSYKDVNGVVRRVGNSVSLRSKRLLELPKQLNMEWRPYHGFYNEDGFICVNNVHVFEEHGCKIAPIELAAEFSTEYRDFYRNGIHERRETFNEVKERIPESVKDSFCFHLSDINIYE